MGGVSIDPGQYYKVHLKCKQAMYVYGSVTVHPTVSRNFEVDIYDANQQLVTSGWIFTGMFGTTTFVSARTVRIPLSDFVGASLSSVRGVRFIFSDTAKGAINLANVRLSNQP